MLDRPNVPLRPSVPDLTSPRSLSHIRSPHAPLRPRPRVPVPAPLSAVACKSFSISHALRAKIQVLFFLAPSQSFFHILVGAEGAWIQGYSKMAAKMDLGG